MKLRMIFYFFSFFSNTPYLKLADLKSIICAWHINTKVGRLVLDVDDQNKGENT